MIIARIFPKIYLDNVFIRYILTGMKHHMKRAMRMKSAESFNPFGRRGGRFGRGGPMHGGTGHPGRRRKQFDNEELRTMILSLIGAGSAHGYDLIRTFSERSGGAYAPSPGMVYPLLSLLLELGLVEDKGDGPRKSLALTDAGKEEVTRQAEEAEKLFRKLDMLAEGAERADPRAVRRAMQNLKMVLIDRMSRGDASEAVINTVVERIDALARDIERL